MVVVQAPIRSARNGPPVPDGNWTQFIGQYFAVVDYAGGGRLFLAVSLWTAVERS